MAGGRAACLTRSGGIGENGMVDLHDKTVVVTGGGGWLGSAMASLAIDRGAAVYVCGRTQEALDLVAGATPLVADLSRERDVATVVRRVVSDTGRLDGWVNNAYAAVGSSPLSASRHVVSDTLGRGVADVIVASQHAARAMSSGGAIVNVASMYGIVSPQPDTYDRHPDAHNPPAYGVAKAGVIQYTRYAAVHLAPKGIRVNCVSPGPFPRETSPADFRAELAARTPLGRVGEPHEVAGAIVFLLSDWASYITGHNLVVDGGWTTW